MKRLAGYCVKWIAFCLLWLLFVYQITMPELLAGAAAAALTVVGLETSLKAEPLHFRPKLRWFAELWKLPATILEDLWVLLQTLARHALKKPSQALFQTTPFRTSGDESHRAGQRCTATVFMSVSPNSVVVDIDTKQDFIMFHQVKASPIPRFVRKLEDS